MYCRYEREQSGIWKSPEQREKEVDEAWPADWLWPGLGERERIVELVITRESRTKEEEQERKDGEKKGGRGNTLGG